MKRVEVNFLVKIAEINYQKVLLKCLNAFSISFINLQAEQ